ncbi:hypothetical protein IE077_004451 [Cardiosporidium cionae]|uniref:Uncharacterized protein n=1 Tax=Cardiosporidium cionae TaxID=476202 RepID=A0ABQ7J9G4_9APIC|nr:hypothetical protein IE077_004451 [Cardiosporidium cionae]|eukprot:KAF8820648.1 hypothetical protein IE077_004451 [Cardiosporidium cionae]
MGVQTPRQIFPYSNFTSTEDLPAHLHAYNAPPTLLDTLALPAKKIRTQWGLIEITRQGCFRFSFFARSEWVSLHREEVSNKASHELPLMTAKLPSYPCVYTSSTTLSHSMKKWRGKPHELHFSVDCGGRCIHIEEPKTGEILQRYHFGELPQRQRLRYTYALEIASAMKTFTPKVGFFQLMSNSPDPDFLVEFEPSIASTTAIRKVEIRKNRISFLSAVHTLCLSLEDLSHFDEDPTECMAHTSAPHVHLREGKKDKIQDFTPEQALSPPHPARLSPNEENEIFPLDPSRDPLEAATANISSLDEVREHFHRAIHASQLSPENVLRVWTLTLRGYRRSLEIEQHSYETFNQYVYGRLPQALARDPLGTVIASSSISPPVLEPILPPSRMPSAQAQSVSTYAEPQDGLSSFWGDSMDVFKREIYHCIFPVFVDSAEEKVGD